jgi:CubicO group peptidase (beta-lactamase class C family)
MSPFELPADPDPVGMSEARLEETKNWIERQTGEGPYGCLIVRHGSLVAEWYGGSFSARSLFEIGSIRKSFNSALMGIGIQEGIVDLNARAADWWSDLVALSGDRADDAITLHQLASGVSGWLTPDSRERCFATATLPLPQPNGLSPECMDSRATRSLQRSSNA